MTLFLVGLLVGIVLAAVPASYMITKALNRLQEALEWNESAYQGMVNASTVIGQAYHELSRASTAEVLYDDPAIRKIVGLMKASHRALGAVVDQLSSSIKEENQDDKDDGQGTSTAAKKAQDDQAT